MRAVAPVVKRDGGDTPAIIRVTVIVKTTHAIKGMDIAWSVHWANGAISATITAPTAYKEQGAVPPMEYAVWDVSRVIMVSVVVTTVVSVLRMDLVIDILELVSMVANPDGRKKIAPMVGNYTCLRI
ncbi:hypothetical protein ACJMK2_030614 [Sinanodonta woodiana]|uniref:Uncharacterized protein n=1 Tax=Sinanodonta woodiana TaxID=1069815 RepID=A0ABD3WW89_SINWO